MGLDAACRDTVLPLGWLMWTRNTIRTRVFLRPMSVSPFLSSMSEFRSFRIPAQSILQSGRNREETITCFLNKSLYSRGKNKNGTWTNHSNHWTFKCIKSSTEIFIDPKLSGFCEAHFGQKWWNQYMYWSFVMTSNDISADFYNVRLWKGDA